MRRDPFLGEGRTGLYCGLNVLPQQVLEPCSGHGVSSGIQEQFRHSGRTPDRQPLAKDRPAFFPQRQQAFPAPLAQNPDARARVEAHVLDLEADEFRGPQTSDEAGVKHGPIPNANARLWIRSIDDGLHLRHGQVAHQPCIGFLRWDRENLPDLVQSRGDPEFHEVHERLDRGEPGVPARTAIAPLGLKVFQKIKDEGGVDLLQAQLRWCSFQPNGCEFYEQAEGVGVGLASVNAGAPFPRKAFTKEIGHVGGQGRHWDRLL